MPRPEELKVFVSSTMTELRDVRAVIREALRKNNINAFLYEEDAGARPGTVVVTSLKQVEESEVFIGLFWQKFGEVTVQEYQHARSLDKPCFVYIRDKNIQRERKLEDFLQAEICDLGKGVTYRYFDNVVELGEQVAKNIIDWLVRERRQRMAEVQATPKQNVVNGKILREEYLKSVREQYRRLELRGLAPQLFEGPTDLLLTEIYIELPLEIGVLPLKEFKPRDPQNQSDAQVERIHATEELQKVHELPKTKYPVEYDSIRKNTSDEKTAKRILSLWDTVARGRTVIVGEPGAGKTTAVRYLALALAGEDNTTMDPRFVGRLPIVARLAKFSRRLETEPGLRLVEYLCHERKFAALLEQELNTGQCLVILDGLDEASNLTGIVKEIEEFTAVYGNNWIVITSREEAFWRAQVGLGFQPVTLKPMERNYTEMFIDQWYRARGASLAVQDGEGQQELKKALDTWPRLAELAKNPLMLTIIVLMHWRAAVLPSRPIEVYQIATDTLIRYWPRSQDRPGIEGLDLQIVRHVLYPIAYRMLSGNKLIDEDELLKMLTEGIMIWWDESRARETATGWLHLISTQSGLLKHEGFDTQGKRIFGFLHERFGEYLAACHLTSCWDGNDTDFVLSHVHKPHWTEVVTLFVAQTGLDRMVLATKAIEAILNLNSPWEQVVWRDHLLAGKCLGEGVLVTGAVLDRVLKSVINLLTSPQADLRAKAIGIFASLQGTQYQQTGIEHVRELLKNEWPWYIEVDIVEALFRLGERRQSRNLLFTFRDVAKQRGYSDGMARIIELLLEGWKEETLDWLVGVASEYNGRGIEPEISAEPSETAVSATDESSGSVRVGKYLTLAELRILAERLMNALALGEEKERVQWLWRQLSEPSVNDVRKLTQAKNQRVRRLSAEWLVEHGDRETGIKILSELVTNGDGNLNAVRALTRINEREIARRGTLTTLTKTLDATTELEAAGLLCELGEGNEPAMTLLELLLSQVMGEGQNYRIAQSLVTTPARDVAIAALEAMAASVRHEYRYEAAKALGETGKVAGAYEAFLDIAERWGVSDRANSIEALNDSRYSELRDRDQLDLCRLAQQVVCEVGNKYSTVTGLLEAGIVPRASDNCKDAINTAPRLTREEWDNNAKQAQDAFRHTAEEWLTTLPEADKANPYAQTAIAYLLALNSQDIVCAQIVKTSCAH